VQAGQVNEFESRKALAQHVKRLDVRGAIQDALGTEICEHRNSDVLVNSAATQIGQNLVHRLDFDKW
jgi:hypothetical protein